MKDFIRFDVNLSNKNVERLFGPFNTKISNSNNKTPIIDCNGYALYYDKKHSKYFWLVQPNMIFNFRFYVEDKMTEKGCPRKTNSLGYVITTSGKSENKEDMSFFLEKCYYKKEGKIFTLGKILFPPKSYKKDVETIKDRIISVSKIKDKEEKREECLKLFNRAMALKVYFKKKSINPVLEEIRNILIKLRKDKENNCEFV